MQIGYLQTAVLFGEKQHNFDAARVLVQRAVSSTPIDLLVLPELFAVGYTFTSREEAASVAEPADGPTAHFLMELAGLTGGTVVAGFAEAEGPAVYNASLIVRGDSILGTYRKLHLYNREKLWFDRGNAAPAVYEASGVPFGVMICFDWYFPETMRMLMLGGALITAHPSNLVLPHCQEAMKTRCLENRMFAITANRIGREQRGPDNFYFTGSSQITAPDGSILSSAPAKESYIDVVSIDPLTAAKKQINNHNDLRADRRVELYTALTRGVTA